jgi:hypothetical protein
MHRTVQCTRPLPPRPRIIARACGPATLFTSPPLIRRWLSPLHLEAVELHRGRSLALQRPTR